jgi:hypothetical protein
MKGVKYAQAREVILRPLDAAQTAAWAAGADVPLPPYPPPQHAPEVQSAAALQAEKEKEALPAPSAPPAAAAGAAAVAATSSAAPSKDKEVARRRSRYDLAPAMTGPRSINVDGELIGFSPCRLRVVAGALAVLC